MDVKGKSRGSFWGSSLKLNFPKALGTQVAGGSRSGFPTLGFSNGSCYCSSLPRGVAVDNSPAQSGRRGHGPVPSRGSDPAGVLPMEEERSSGVPFFSFLYSHPPPSSGVLKLRQGPPRRAPGGRAPGA